MTVLAVSTREGRIGGGSQQSLEKVVLAALCGARVVVEGEDLFGDQGVEHALDFLLRLVAQRGDPGRHKRLTVDRGVLEHSALCRGQAVESRRRERVQRLGDVELAHIAGQHIARPLLREQPAVQQHADGLDGIQRNPLGAADDASEEILGQPGHESLEGLPHRGVGQRFEQHGLRAPRGSCI